MHSSCPACTLSNAKCYGLDRSRRKPHQIRQTSRTGSRQSLIRSVQFNKRFKPSSIHKATFDNSVCAMAVARIARPVTRLISSRPQNILKTLAIRSSPFLPAPSSRRSYATPSGVKEVVVRQDRRRQISLDKCIANSPSETLSMKLLARN